MRRLTKVPFLCSAAPEVEGRGAGDASHVLQLLGNERNSRYPLYSGTSRNEICPIHPSKSSFIFSYFAQAGK